MRLTEIESIYSKRSSSVVVVEDVVRWKWKQEPLFTACNLNHTDVRDLSHPPAVIVTCRVLSRNLVRNACSSLIQIGLISVCVIIPTSVFPLQAHQLTFLAIFTRFAYYFRLTLTIQVNFST